MHTLMKKFSSLTWHQDLISHYSSIFISSSTPLQSLCFSLSGHLSGNLWNSGTNLLSTLCVCMVTFFKIFTLPGVQLFPQSSSSRKKEWLNTQICLFLIHWSGNLYMVMMTWMINFLEKVIYCTQFKFPLGFAKIQLQMEE